MARLWSYGRWGLEQNWLRLRKKKEEELHEERKTAVSIISTYTYATGTAP